MSTAKGGHLRHSIHQVRQVDQAHRQLLYLVPHSTALFLLLKVASFAPVLSIIAYLAEVLIDFPDNADDRLR